MRKACDDVINQKKKWGEDKSNIWESPKHFIETGEVLVLEKACW